MSPAKMLSTFSALHVFSEKTQNLKGLLGKSTVDGRNPAPVDMVNIPLFIGFHEMITGGAGFPPLLHKGSGISLTKPSLGVRSGEVAII